MILLQRNFDARTHDGIYAAISVQPGPGQMTTIQLAVKGKQFRGKLEEPVRGTGSFATGTQGEFWYSFASFTFEDFIRSTGFNESTTNPQIAQDAVSWLIRNSLHESAFNKTLWLLRDLMQNGEPLVTGYATLVD